MSLCREASDKENWEDVEAVGINVRVEDLTWDDWLELRKLAEKARRRVFS